MAQQRVWGPVVPDSDQALGHSRNTPDCHTSAARVSKPRGSLFRVPQRHQLKLPLLHHDKIVLRIQRSDTLLWRTFHISNLLGI